MEQIVIKFKDGREDRKFEHHPRAGGSWTLRIKYEGAFAIVIDEYDNTDAFPAQDIEHIHTTAERGSW